jgi:YD repeat-containing protein
MKNIRISIYGLICLVVILITTSTGTCETYTYDNLNRIIRVDYGSASFVDYAYDKEGNITACNAQAEVIFGDIDNSTNVTLEDASLILSIQSGQTVTREILMKADMDADQKISSTELIKVLQTLSK